jgi:hypothetical protein
MRLNTTVCALLIAASAAAQQIIIPPWPATPGEALELMLLNDTPNPMGVPVGNPVSMQHPDGGVIIYPQIADYSMPLPPGESISILLDIPAQGPGSYGSFVLRWREAAVRLDVGAPSASFPAIHTSPWFGSHQTHPNFFGIHWEATNTGSTWHAFGPSDMLRVYSPGGTVPLMAASLAGVVLPPQRGLTGILSFDGITPGPLTIEVTWTDPATNAVTSVRHGVRPWTYNFVDVGLPGGHVIPTGGVLPVELMLLVDSPSAPFYAFCVGIAPGSTPVPGGDLFPLVYDAAVLASLTDGIGGLLIANVGQATPVIAQVLNLAWRASGIGITHPGAAFSGMTVRCAALGYEAGQGILMVSQGEDLVIQ